MADAHASYGVRPWLIYESKDPLRAIHGRAGVDAIVIETPYERVRYYAYLHRLQGDALTKTLVRTLAAQARDHLGFVIYAHSKTGEDRTFLSRFSNARLEGTAPGETPLDRVIFGPSSDFYDVGSFREERWVGSLTYRFALPACASRESLRFSDGYGDRYDVAFNLRRFQ